MGRPRTPLLDRERITTAALALVDEQGEVSLPQIARRLGVQTGSLYHHVDGREGVIELIREHVSYRIDSSMLDVPPWDEALAGWARSYRAAFAAHPRAIPLLLATPVRTPRVLGQYEQAVRMLNEAGFALRDVLTMITAVENLIFGSALDLAAPDPIWDLSGQSDVPALSQAMAAAPPSRADDAFELALAACLTRFRTLASR
ncbi:TetR/AcrR family transcriptional regulator C-terminal domain-containing protein [Nonomuraea sp. NPDC055795]